MFVKGKETRKKIELHKKTTLTPNSGEQKTRKKVKILGKQRRNFRVSLVRRNLFEQDDKTPNADGTTGAGTTATQVAGTTATSPGVLFFAFTE